MKQWFNTNELAGIDGMPGTAQGVRDKAKRENWKWRKKAVRKGKEYHIKSLPVVTQLYLELLSGGKTVVKNNPSFLFRIKRYLCQRICSTQGVKK